MSNITKLEFVALDISGKNYLSWILDAKIHLDAMNIGAMIKEGNQASLQDCAKTLIFLRRHFHKGLTKNEFLMRNHQSRPTRFESFPEMNAISFQNHGRRRGRGRGCGHGRNPRYHGSYNNNSHKMKVSLHHQKWNNIDAKQENENRLQDKPPKNHENNCFVDPQFCPFSTCL